MSSHPTPTPYTLERARKKEVFFLKNLEILYLIDTKIVKFELN